MRHVMQYANEVMCMSRDQLELIAAERSQRPPFILFFSKWGLSMEESLSLEKN